MKSDACSIQVNVLYSCLEDFCCLLPHAIIVTLPLIWVYFSMAEFIRKKHDYLNSSAFEQNASGGIFIE